MLRCHSFSFDVSRKARSKVFVFQVGNLERGEKDVANYLKKSLEEGRVGGLKGTLLAEAD